MIGFYLVLVEFLAVDGSPSIYDVGEDERYEQRYIEHRAERELTRAGVLDGQR